jgi:hypothetical protein
MGSKWAIFSVTDRSNNSEREISSIAKGSHDNGESVKLWRRTTYKHHCHPEKATNDCANQHIDRDKPPKGNVLKRDAFTKLGENQAGQEQSKN